MSGTITPTRRSPTAPSSPQAHIVSQYSSDEIPSPTEGQRPPAQDLRMSPRHPSSATQMQRNRTRVLSNLNLAHNVDLRAVTYESIVDENLMCPICHCPLVDPVMTECDHIFCRSCIEESVTHSRTCPIDRSPLDQDVRELKRAPKIVINQLDGLKAKCPACGMGFARSMLENHLEKYCPETIMRCPGRNEEIECRENVKRKLAGRGCLHFETECIDCGEKLLEVDMEEHREEMCKERFQGCEYCGVEILRCRTVEHEKVCKDIIAPCQWAGYGCQHGAKRKDLYLHTNECGFKTVGPMTDMLRKEIGDLRSEVRTLTEANQRHERRLKFMESGTSQNFTSPPYPSDLSLPSSSHLPDPLPTTDPLDSGHQYLLSLLEAQESNLSHLSSSLTESEAKQTTMLFNETIPMKNELAEIRSMQQTTSMHVRWLMRFRIQENSRRVVGGPGPGNGSGGSGGVGSYGAGGGGGGGSSDGGGGDSILPRRLSDTMSRELITKL
ncbi:hypothetical protein WAI453_002139 [Rhynchosporium graminicola]|uniref:Uncharacterized protein n=1 Tax=Rhynchosporium graminicola TaxID=2792576 RepID=A0A1E1KWP3_9HELO|nr:uncharacterized protein RCO7_09397 [Rhynchosporium commune]